MDKVKEKFKEYLKQLNKDNVLLLSLVENNFDNRRKFLEFIVDNIDISENVKKVLKKMSDYNLENNLIEILNLLIILQKEEKVINRINNDYFNIYQPLDKNGQEYIQ